MSVKIRLHRAGAKHRPFYRVVVADSRSPRDGRFIEMVGYYDPLPKNELVKLDAERTKYWIDRGATASPTVRSLLKRAESAPSIAGIAADAVEKRRAAIEEANRLAPTKPAPRKEEEKPRARPATKPEPPKAEARPAQKPAAKPAAEAPKAEAKPAAKPAAAAPKAEAVKPDTKAEERPEKS